MAKPVDVGSLAPRHDQDVYTPSPVRKGQAVGSGMSRCGWWEGAATGDRPESCMVGSASVGCITVGKCL
jgi:hypothetical protein